jgi:hypothetical protein
LDEKVRYLCDTIGKASFVAKQIPSLKGFDIFCNNIKSNLNDDQMSQKADAPKILFKTLGLTIGVKKFWIRHAPKKCFLCLYLQVKRFSIFPNQFKTMGKPLS